MIYNIRGTDVGRNSQNFSNSQLPISSTVPVVVFHDTSVHRHLSVAGVYHIVRSNLAVFESYHNRSRLESGPRLKHITDGIVTHFVILAVLALHHVDDCFHFSGSYFHQYHHAYAGIQLFQLVYQCFLANILHAYVDGTNQIATVNRRHIDNVQVFVHHFLAVRQSVPSFQDSVESKFDTISGSFGCICIHISQRTGSQ